MTCFGDFDSVRQLPLIVFEIAFQPGADHSLESIFVGNSGNRLVAFGTGKGAYPTDVRLNNAQAFANLRLADLRARALAGDVGAEGDTVEFIFQYFMKEGDQLLVGYIGKVNSGQSH